MGTTCILSGAWRAQPAVPVWTAPMNGQTTTRKLDRTSPESPPRFRYDGEFDRHLADGHQKLGRKPETFSSLFKKHIDGEVLCRYTDDVYVRYRRRGPAMRDSLEPGNTRSPGVWRISDAKQIHELASHSDWRLTIELTGPPQRCCLGYCAY
jgi:hypothetical protein